MSYRIRTESFEGPFDLLLYLVNRQRIDIGSINISQIANQYLDEVARMRRLDLDVASDFLVVAATLLEIKAASLLPGERDGLEGDLGDIGVAEARDILLARLLEYKKYRNAALALGSRQEAAGRCHPRTCGAPAELMGLCPDYLENVGLDDLARRFVACLARRDRFLLESEHIAGKPIALEAYVTMLTRRVSREGGFRFSEVLPANAPAPVVVVTFLALLELMKRNLVRVRQDELFGDIEVERVRDFAGAAADGGAGGSECDREGS